MICIEILFIFSWAYFMLRKLFNRESDHGASMPTFFEAVQNYRDKYLGG